MHSYDRRPPSMRKQGFYIKKCRVPNCNQNHASHYCRFCLNKNSDHLSSNCQYQQNNHNRNSNKSPLYSNYNNRQSSSKKSNFQQKKCRIKDCIQFHLSHYCKICLDKDSDHFSSKCPNKHGYGQYSQNNNMNTRSRQYQNKRIQREQDNYGYKKQNNYGNFYNNNTNKINNYNDYDNGSNGYKNKQASSMNNFNNQNNRKCGIKQCRQFHEKHQCKVCRDINSDHFYQDCPNGIILFNVKSKNSKQKQKIPQILQFQNQQGSLFISHWETVLKLLNQGHKVIKYKIKNQFNFMQGVTPNWIEQVKTQHHKGYFINKQNVKKLDYIENVY